MTTLWACEPHALEQFLVDRESAMMLLSEQPLIVASLGDDEDSDPIDDILDIDGATGQAHIAIAGPLMQSTPAIYKYFGIKCGAYDTIHGAISRASSDPAVKQLVFHVNSPGGEVVGVDAIWQAIHACDKPCAAIAEGLMASAAYWIASAVGAGNLYASSPADEIGSIGVRAVLMDSSKAREKDGVKKYEFVSKGAPNKVSDPATEGGRAQIQGEIDALERIFHSRVAEGRGTTMDMVSANYGHGGLLVARDPDASKPCAISAGMIDGIRASVPVPQLIPAQPYQSSATPAPAPSPIPSKVPAVAGKEKSMNLDEFLRENPDAAARVQTLIAEAEAKGMAAARANAVKVGAILTSDAYKANSVIQAKGLEALQGKISVEAFDTIVSTVDAITAAGHIAAETLKPAPDTPPAATSADAGLVAKAVALKLDPVKIQAAAKSSGMDPAKALAGEIELAEMIAADKGRA